MNPLIKTSLALLIGLGLSNVVLAELPQISDARVVQPPPGSNVAAAFFTINNSGSESLEITGASSDIAKKVEVHLSFIENDVAKMEKQASVIVEAGESIEFTHGSFHVMFMGLNEELLAGHSLDLTLTTSAGDISVSVPVISLDEAMSRQNMEHGMEHDSGKMDSMKKDMKDSMHNGHGTKK